VIAASGITHKEMTDEVISFFQRNNFERGDETTPLARPLFDEVEKMRADGIDSVERALVAPHRAALLGKGIHSLVDYEESFPDRNEE
jgi:hypothetical protein